MSHLGLLQRMNLISTQDFLKHHYLYDYHCNGTPDIIKLLREGASLDLTVSEVPAHGRLLLLLRACPDNIQWEEYFDRAKNRRKKNSSPWFHDYLQEHAFSNLKDLLLGHISSKSPPSPQRGNLKNKL